MPPELKARNDASIERQPEPKPSRSEAIRRLVKRGLSACASSSTFSGRIRAEVVGLPTKLLSPHRTFYMVR